jgi:hypothetical protein
LPGFTSRRAHHWPSSSSMTQVPSYLRVATMSSNDEVSTHAAAGLTSAVT